MKLLPTFLVTFSFAIIIFLIAPGPIQANDYSYDWLLQRRDFPSVPPRPTLPPFPYTQVRSTPTTTPQPTIAPSITPTPTVSPTPSASPNPTVNPTPTPTPAPNATDTIQTYIMNAINEYRKSLGLSAVKTDPYTCNFAAIRAQEITSGFNHDGFTSRVANKTVPYPGYSLITENIAMTSDYRRVVNLWINSPAHAANMQKDTPYVCVENYGNYYAYEGWRP